MDSNNEKQSAGYFKNNECIKGFFSGGSIFCNPLPKVLLDSLPYMLWVKDLNGRFKFVNQLFSDVSEKEFDFIIGKTDYEVWGNKLADSYVRDDEKVINSRKTLNLEEKIIDKNEEKWFETFKAPIVDENGKIVGTIGTARDITLRKRLEKQLDEHKLFVQQMIDSSPDLIFFKNKDGVYLGCNETFAKDFIGLAKEQIIGKSDFDLFEDKELAEFFVKKDYLVLESGKSKINEETVNMQNGDTIWLETMKTPFFDDKGNVRGLIGISRDITQRKKMEQELADEKERAEKANAMKSQFIANFSHEVRTPMNAILGYTTLLKDCIKDEQSLQYIESVQKAGTELIDLISDILDISKIEAGKIDLQYDYASIQKIIEDVRNIFAFKAKEKQLAVSIIIEPTVPETIYIDENRLKQILFNLVGNALKFTDFGAIEIIVKANYKDNIEEGKNLINIVDLQFEVKDTGIGIPKEDQNLIFEPFRQKEGQDNKKFGGTGLGLSISKKLAEMMGGRIDVASEEGIGSTFTINIPNVKTGAQHFRDSLKLRELNYFLEKEIKEVYAIKLEDLDTDFKNKVQLNINETLDDVLLELEKIYSGIWYECSKCNRLKDIKEFSNQLMKIIENRDLEELNLYSKKIFDAAEKFNSSEIRDLLRLFPEIIEKYRRD